jgi:hypothetical protein
MPCQPPGISLEGDQVGQATAVNEDIRSPDLRSQNQPRPNGMSELELLRTITGGLASFGNAVRLSALSNEQKSKVLAHLAETSTRMMEATNAYLFELGQVRKPTAVAAVSADDEARAGAVGTQAVAAALLVAG